VCTWLFVVGVSGCAHTRALAPGVAKLYKILFHLSALVWESNHPLPPPSRNAYPVAILLHDFCAIYAPQPTPPLRAIHHTLLVIAILCKGQGVTLKP